MKNLTCASLWMALGIAATALAGCGSTSGGGLPLGALRSGSNAIVQDKRGRVTLFADTFGDPVPTGIVTGPDGALWFVDAGNAVIGRITTRGKYTLQMPAGAELSDGIAAGPDKNLWFTANASTPKVGRITTAGVVTLFTDSGGSFPQDIIAGSDGALWFTESNGEIGRMTTSGKVMHFTVAESADQLEGIVTGPDGNLWVTQHVEGSHFSNKVIRVSLTGRHHAFTVGSGPDFICVGPDGALWFTEQNANALGRLTVAGKYTQFPTGFKYMQPSGIATGPDHALWFTDFSGRAGIGRMTTSGSVKFYHVPGSLPELVEITAGPDGRMWFTSDLGPSAIGRITTQ